MKVWKDVISKEVDDFMMKYDGISPDNFNAVMDDFVGLSPAKQIQIFFMIFGSHQSNQVALVDFVNEKLRDIADLIYVEEAEEEEFNG